MKGIVFCLLNEMVEEQFGLEAWDDLLDAVGTDGVYVATETYDDAELLALVAAAEKATGIAAADLVRQFGAYMIPHFAKNYATFFENQTSLKAFLLSVDQVIHVEVRKLYPDAGLPTFDYEDEQDNELTMIYKSPRKLCALAEGLIAGSAAHFGEQYELRHDICMHKGDDHCALHMTLTS